MKQSEAFLRGEGEAWLERNREKIQAKADNDYVLRAIEDCPTIVPRRVLEVGCADGWRLDLMEEGWGCDVEGIDPGSTTRKPGTADDLSRFPTNRFNVVIYGFCLYLCDREDLLKIVAEGDRVLEDGGFLIIYDFYSPVPHSVKYKHLDGILSYKMDYSKLWLANPAYSVYRRQIYGEMDDLTSVVILKKNNANGWPLKEST